VRNQKRSFASFLREWQIHAAGRLAPGSVDDYSRDIVGFLKSVKGLRIESIRLTHLEQHVAPLAPAHRRRSIAALRNFWAFIADESGIKNPARLLSSKQTSKTLSEFLSDEGVAPALTHGLSYRQWLVAAANGRSEIKVGGRSVALPTAHWRRIARSFARSLAQVRTASEFDDLLDQRLLGRAKTRPKA